MVRMQGEVELRIPLDNISQNGDPFENVSLPCGIAMRARRFWELIEPFSFSECEIQKSKGRMIGRPQPDGSDTLGCELSECDRMSSQGLR